MRKKTMMVVPRGQDMDEMSLVAETGAGLAGLPWWDLAEG